LPYVIIGIDWRTNVRDDRGVAPSLGQRAARSGTGSPNMAAGENGSGIVLAQSFSLIVF